MRSPDVSPGPRTARRAPLHPLLAKEAREIVSGRALWTLLLIVCPLIGYSFFQAVSLYGEASAAALQSPVMASGLSPLDGVLVPTFGASYIAGTLLFPFVAIRVLSHEKESGALRLLVQLPYPTPTLIGAKLAVILAAWVVAMLPALSSLVVWCALGGHLAAAETTNLLLGHLLYGLAVGSIALFAAAVTDSGAVAAIVALAFTIGSWVLDFTLAGRPGLADWIARLSLTQILRPFEQGLWSAGLVLGVIVASLGFAALAAVWLRPGVALRRRIVGSVLCVLATAVALALCAQATLTVDVAEDRRNSFALADERALASLTDPLVVTAHFTAEDPRYIDLQRNVLAKLARVMPNVTIRLVGGRQGFATGSNDEAYGAVVYNYATRSDVSRSTSPREILPLLYDLAQVPRPEPIPGTDYPGYPLVADAMWALPWFFGPLPLLIGFGWWCSRRPPSSKLLKRLTEAPK